MTAREAEEPRPGLCGCSGRWMLTRIRSIDHLHPLFWPCTRWKCGATRPAHLWPRSRWVFLNHSPLADAHQVFQGNPASCLWQPNPHTDDRCAFTCY